MYVASLVGVQRALNGYDRPPCAECTRPSLGMVGLVQSVRALPEYDLV